MRPVSITQTGTGDSGLIVLDYLNTPFNVSISTKVSGTVSYTVQHTFDDVFASGYDASTGTWYNSDDSNMVSATTNQNSNFAFPVRACRVTNVGAGSVTLTAIQGLQN